jgi:hypothetical protein
LTPLESRPVTILRTCSFGLRVGLFVSAHVTLSLLIFALLDHLPRAPRRLLLSCVVFGHRVTERAFNPLQDRIVAFEFPPSYSE